MTVHAPAGASCGPRPCWSAAGTKGFKYKDKLGTNDGLLKLSLTAAPDGRAKIGLKAKGENVPLPALEALVFPLRVQLQARNGNCWEATYGSAVVQTSGRIKAASD